MAIDRIAGSGIQAQLRAAENAAHNISQVNVDAPQLVSTRFESAAPAPPRGGGGVRAETELRSRSQSPVLDPSVNETFVREQVDIAQELTDLLTARRAFQANLAVERTYRAFPDATLTLAAWSPFRARRPRGSRRRGGETSLPCHPFPHRPAPIRRRGRRSEDVAITKIEASAVIPAAPSQVWQSLLDSRRWAHWLPEGAAARIERIEPTDDTFERVGDRRRCSAIVSGFPLMGERRLAWNEWVTDVDRGRTLEIESLPASHAIRRWRVRFWLVADETEGTRLRCHVSYRPASFAGWLADRLLLRRRVTEATTTWLNNLAASFAPEIAAEPHILEPGEALVAA